MPEYLAFGAGPPSLALAILNAWGEVHPRAEVVLFADTGWEKRQTYELMPVYDAWMAENGLELVNVKSPDGPLQDYIATRSLPIPVHTVGGLGRRQCTDKWKIRPCEVYMHQRFGYVPLTAQLGMTYDEGWRVRDPRVKRNTNRYPLIEKELRRSDTVEIIKMAGLPVPPWSSCLGCPLQSDGRWRQLAADHSDDFDQAAGLDELIRERGNSGKGPVWLHYSKRPLGQIYSTSQLSMLPDNDGDQGLCESGYCHH